jgi:hypothetical protein
VQRPHRQRQSPSVRAGTSPDRRLLLRWRAIKVVAHVFSQSAAEKIKAAGGSAEVIGA